MKIHYLFILTFLFSCTSKTKTAENELIPNDTIRTSSGLQYYFLKKGDGRKIEKGSKVSAFMNLYLNDVDTIFWSSGESDDSVFTWIEGHTSVIEGAVELYPFLREGDEVVAIMPDSIAYGKEDKNGLPGGSTLIFNPITVKTVSEPKKVISDTLLTADQNIKTEDMIAIYKRIMDSEERENYHSDVEIVALDVLGTLFKEQKFEALMALAEVMKSYAESTADLQAVRQYEAYAAYQSGQLERAMDIINVALEDKPDHAWFNQVKQSLLKEMEDPSE